MSQLLLICLLAWGSHAASQDYRRSNKIRPFQMAPPAYTSLKLELELRDSTSSNSPRMSTSSSLSDLTQKAPTSTWDSPTTTSLKPSTSTSDLRPRLQSAFKSLADLEPRLRLRSSSSSADLTPEQPILRSSTELNPALPTSSTSTDLASEQQPVFVSLTELKPGLRTSSTSTEVTPELRTSSSLSEALGLRALWWSVDLTQEPFVAAPNVLNWTNDGRDSWISIDYISTDQAHPLPTCHLHQICDKVIECIVSKGSPELPEDLFQHFCYVHVDVQHKGVQYVLHWYEPKSPVPWLASKMKGEKLLSPLLSSMEDIMFGNKNIEDCLKAALLKIADQVADLYADATLKDCLNYLAQNSERLNQLLSNDESSELDASCVVSQILQNLSEKQVKDFNREMGKIVAHRLKRIPNLTNIIGDALESVLPRIDPNMTYKKERGWFWKLMFRSQKNLVVNGHDCHLIITALKKQLMAANWDQICQAYLARYELIMSNVPSHLMSKPSLKIGMVKSKPEFASQA